jgi:DNA-binding NtrC family response regulator
MSRILVVDDEASICWAFRESLTDEGHEVEVAASAEEGLKLAQQGAPDAVILDIRLPGVDGLAALADFRRIIGPAPIVIITAFGNLDTAVRAMESGAFDYLVKPFDLDQAVTAVKRALEKQRPERPDPTERVAEEPETLLGTSPAMQALFKRIALVAPTDVPVLITGESGTGKDLVARAIHRHSARRAGPFLPICLAALSPSLIERELFGHVKGSFTGAAGDSKGLLALASGGTVLLDEVGDVPTSLQVKLLRAIEHREVTPVGDARPQPTDIRLVAATNRPLAQLIAEGQFREDLYFRLSVFPIHVPPLRDRPEDIPVLAEHFLRQTRLPEVADTHLSDAVIEELRARHWSGNARELRNAIEHAAIVARGRTIRPEHLPAAEPIVAGSLVSDAGELEDLLTAWAERAALRHTDPSAEPRLHEQFLELCEPPLLRAALKHCHGNRLAAAQLLGMHRATLRQKLRKYGIE